jgi:hypothetical protein
MQMRFLPSIMTALTALTLTSCSTTTAEQYEATALTSYTWQVKYANDLTSQPQPRIETFANTSMLNRNGLKPAGAVVGPDNRGLWGKRLGLKRKGLLGLSLSLHLTPHTPPQRGLVSNKLEINTELLFNCQY